MPTSTLVLTIAPDHDGKTTLWVSLRDADGTPSPPRAIPVDQDWRLGAFVANVQTIARQHLAAIESAGVRPAARRDGKPAIADAADGKQVWQRS